MKKFLVTSALEQTWPDEQQQIVFLGEWCKLFSEKSKWDNPNNTTAPYHWDDRDKFHRDFDYLQVLYEKILGQLSLKLNDIHLVNHSKSYWRIVIGPWLNYFIGIVFDRWFMLDEVIKSGAVTHCNVISQMYGDATPNDMAEFSKCWAQDSWNEAIYSELLYLLDDGNKVVIENLISEQQNVITTQTSFDSSSIRSKLLDLFSYSESNIFCKNVYVLEGLPKFQSLKIQLSLNQIPKLWRRKKTPQGENSTDYWAFAPWRCVRGKWGRPPDR